MSTRTSHRSRRTRSITLAIATITIVVPALSYAFSRVSPATTTHEVEINATPQQVWEALADFDSYPEWNPHITRISGDPQVGQRLDFDTTAGDSSMRFTPKVLVADPGAELRWLGHVAFPGLLDGEHSFTLADTTRLIQSESFTGVLAPFSPLMVDLDASFEAANHALRDRVEAH